MLLSILKISGHSMEPTIKNGSFVMISSVPYIFKEPKVEEIIILKKDKKVFVKRIKEINGNKIYVRGDNRNDSLEVGWIIKQEILGKLLFKF